MTESASVVPTSSEEPSITPAGSDDVRRWACIAARAAAGKSDAPSIVLEVAPLLSIVEYFVITSGRNTRQVKALVDEVEDQIAKAGGPKPVRIEGRDTHQWALMDYGDFVVHVFIDEMRKFYDLEKLWADVPRVDWASLVEAEAPDDEDVLDERGETDID